MIDPHATDAASEAPADTGAESADSHPSVDELEARLQDLQGAMEQLQTGDLDGAELAIEALEQRIDTTRD